MISTYPVISGKYLINGEWKEIRETANVINPANMSEIVGEVALCSKGIVNEAIEAAEKAYNTWSRSDVKDRSTLMNKAAEKLANIIEENVTLFVRENGKTLVEAKKDLLQKCLQEPKKSKLEEEQEALQQSLLLGILP
jgi:acyl-CoA reductase-like NAD-dependent aldehyde dehydrogenase